MKHHFTASERLALTVHGLVLQGGLLQKPGLCRWDSLTDMQSKTTEEEEWHEHNRTRNRFVTRTITFSFEPIVGETPQLRITLEGDELEELFDEEDDPKRYIYWRLEKIEEGTLPQRSKTAKWCPVEMPVSATDLHFFMGSGSHEESLIKRRGRQPIPA